MNAVINEERMIVENFGLVGQIAKEFRGHVPHEDLIQEGRIGLIHAVRRFEPERGLRIITYASHWIRAYMGAYVMRNRACVRLGTSVGTRQVIWRLSKARRRLEAAGKSTDAASLAKEMGVPVADVENMLPRLTPGGEVSFDAPESVWMRSTPNANPRIDEVLVETQLQLRRQVLVPEAIAKLSKRYRYIIEQHFFCGRSLQSIGDELGISRERTRQVKMKAMEQLRKVLAGEELL